MGKLKVTQPDGKVRDATDEELNAFVEAVGEEAARAAGVLEDNTPKVCPVTGEPCAKPDCDKSNCALEGGEPEGSEEAPVEEDPKPAPKARQRRTGQAKKGN